ncbi:MAG: sel1 repeat family protein [Caulobacteraceae bacterium]|nr:sel1 repeat family protein [Caulobacteraceae bacterium]
MNRRRPAILAAVAVTIGLLGLAAQSAIHENERKEECLGVPSAHPLLQSRAARGDAAAENELGVSYECGKGVQRDDALALKWYGRAADQGVAVAQNNMGRMYARGQGVRRDYVEAMKWFQKAAAQGNAEAMNNVGRLYGEGKGVSKDRIEALKWMYLAIDHYSDETTQEPDYATHNRDGLASTMSQSDVAEAKRRAALVATDGGRPQWMGRDQYDLLSKLGIDPTKDIAEKGNYHWRWKAARRLAAAAYHCPAGSTVDISRSIVLLTAPPDTLCEGPNGTQIEFLKLHPDGSAEPLAE